MNIKEIFFGISYSSTVGPFIGLAGSITSGFIALVRKIQSLIAKIQLVKIESCEKAKADLRNKMFLYDHAAEEYLRLSVIFLISAVPIAGFFFAQHYIIKPIKSYQIIPFESEGNTSK